MALPIIVNGDKVEFVRAETLASLLRRMQYKIPHVVVKVNNEVVPHRDYESAALTDRANVEVVNIID